MAAMSTSGPQSLWDHQQTGIIKLSAAIQAGSRSPCMVAMTGSGKTRVAAEIVARAAEKGKRALILTHRRILLAQTQAVLHSRGVDHGVFAAGYCHDETEGVQLGSIQTVAARLLRKSADFPHFDLVLVDEAHSNTEKDARAIIETYKKRGNVVIGMTATPVGLEGIYSSLVNIASNSELVDKGILVNGTVFAPTEPDMKGVKMVKGEFVQSQARQRVMQCIVFGDIFEHYARLNPTCRPTVLFAPGIQESIGFVEQFNAMGIRAAHIDGSTKTEEREAIFDSMRAGETKLVSSCGVLREGWDFPAVSHGILVQACGALSTFIQLVGRLKRAFPGKTEYTLQDHAGAWWRHGSPDADREWSLKDTDASIAKKHKAGCQDPDGPPQPIRCPQCSGVRQSGPECPWCGHKHKMSVRVVRTVQGTLEKMVGNAIKRKPKETEHGNDIKTWRGCLYKCGRSKKGMTFRQAQWLFKGIRGQWPPAGLPDMPAHGSVDWDRKVADVCPQYARQRTFTGAIK